MLTRTMIALVALATSFSMVPLPSAPAAVSNVVNEGRDFASEAYGDAWDFANPADHSTVPGVREVGLEGLASIGGKLQFSASKNGKLILLDSWDRGAIPWGRDGATSPVSAGRFVEMTFQMYSSTDGGGQIVWLSCGQLRPECLGGRQFFYQQGWHTYSVQLSGPRDFGSVDWVGEIKGLLMQFDTPTSVEIDWIRVHENTAGTSSSVPGSGTVFWDLDRDPTNNTGNSSRWGETGATTTGGAVVVRTDRLPPGIYHLFTKTAGGSVSYGDSITIDAAPQPVLVTPSLSGGQDYASEMRGDAWDFAQGGDVAFVNNVSFSVAGGLLTGTNGGSLPSDSMVYVDVDEPIDTAVWHRLYVRVYYEGSFSLAAAPGGGMNARVAWRNASTKDYFASDDIVVYPGWNEIEIDLAGTQTGAPWVGLVDQFRFDPHEDPAARVFKIDHLSLGRDTMLSGETFDFTVRDGAFEPGSTASIYIDTDRIGFNGTKVATVAMGGGTASISWTPDKAHRGSTWWPYVVVRDPRGQTSRSYAQGPLVVTQAVGFVPDVGLGVVPFGVVDWVRPLGDGVGVQGWVIDPSTPDPVAVHVYVDGKVVGGLVADVDRPGVGRVYSEYGSEHGFSGVFEVSAGSHRVCVFGINVGPGNNRLLGCQTTP